jgi:pimeloyl-ACP methyl ester carboxylesterase
VRFRCALGSCGETPPAPDDSARRAWDARRASLRGLAAVADHADDPARLARFRRPVLIVTGSTTVAFHRRIDEILAATLPRARRLELPGGHGAVSSARDAFVTALRAFLDGRRRSP